jgi:hypothetical protein
MTTYDQFELGTHTGYSGSYSDNIIISFSGSKFTDRKFLGSKTEQIVRDDFNDFDLRYGDFIRLIYNEGVSFPRNVFKNNFGRNNTFVKHINSDEIIYDSLVPSPVEYHIKNGFYPLLSLQFTGSVQLGIPSFSDKQSCSIFIGKNKDDAVIFHPVTSIGTLSFIDTSWLTCFPFESKYNTLIRKKSLTNYLPNSVVCIDPFENAEVDPYSHSEALNIEVNYASMPVGNCNIFNGVVGTIINHYTNIIESPLKLNDFTKDRVKDLLAPSVWKMSSAAQTFEVSKKKVPKLEDTYKAYFGTIRKRIPEVQIVNFKKEDLRYIPEYLDVCIGSMGSKVDLFYTTPVPAGWKYGLYSALPTQTNMVFRRNRFGQFRDILEQRLFTRFSAEGGSTSQSPVVATFISGTAAYYSSTNDLTVNFRDSGIYRSDYTSGRPFADDM